MGDMIRIFSRAGRVLAYINADAYRLWLLNDVGKAKFNLSVLDPAFKQEYIQYGNWILIENDKLPPWIGIIDTPRKWGKFRVEVNAKSAAHWLYFRRGAANLVLNGTSGSLFRQIIEFGQSAEPNIIRMGDIYEEVKSRQETLTYSDLLRQIQSLSERCQNDFDFSPQVDIRGNLSVYANWYIRQGVPVEYTLDEAYNLSAEASGFTEDGDIVNDFLAVGDAASGDTRPTWKETDLSSIGAYGLRQTADTFRNVTEAATLQTHAQAELKQRKTPEKNFELAALDIGDTWKYLRLGNTLRVKLWSVGFAIDTRARITGMSYTPENGKVDLIVQENI